MIPFYKARRLYREGKPLLPSLDDFIGGLEFYGEMEFRYHGRGFCVIEFSDEQENSKIELCENKKPESSQVFDTYEDFKKNAHIDGKLLKDIWDEVVNAYYMTCG